MLKHFKSVPKIYKDATISKAVKGAWNPALYEVSAKYLTGFLQNVPNGLAPFFTGSSNTGKTYAAAAITNYLDREAKKLYGYDDWNAWSEVGYVWAQANDLFSTLATLQDHRRSEFWELNALLRNAPWMVLDDISHIREYERHRELFWQYVDHRYNQGLPTLFTANFKMEKGLETLDEIFGEPLRRRFKAMAGDFTLVVTND